jgi:hypothetical protein
MRIDSTPYTPKVQASPQQKTIAPNHAHMAASKFTELLNQVGDGSKSGGYKLSAFQMPALSGPDEQKDNRGGIFV